jgi:hypothetical protein
MRRETFLVRELLDAFFILSPFSTAGEPSADDSNIVVVAALGVNDN